MKRRAPNRLAISFLIILLSMSCIGSFTLVHSDQTLVYQWSQNGHTGFLNPIVGDESAQSFYNYNPDSGSGDNPYMVYQQSMIYLYADPEGGLSLFIHHSGPVNAPDPESGGTSESMNITGLPGSASLLVVDDPGEVTQHGSVVAGVWSEPSLYSTDGCVIGGLAGTTWSITIYPQFTQGIIGWNIINETGEIAAAVPLGMTSPLTISSTTQEVPVPAGSNVQVTPTPTLSLTFSQVLTAGIATAATSATPPAGVPPLPGEITSYYNIQTTAIFTNMVTVAITYNPNGLSIAQQEKLRMDQTDGLPLGDVNKDGVVNAKDLALALLALGSTPGSPRWNPNADLNHDGKVTREDVNIVLQNMGKGTWTDITVRVDIQNHIVYGATDHFSYFGVH